MVIANVIVFLVTWYSVGMEKNCTIDKGDVLVFQVRPISIPYVGTYLFRLTPDCFQDLAAIAMGIGLLTALFFYITTKEYDDQDVRDAVIIWRREEAESNLNDFWHYSSSNCFSCKRVNMLLYRLQKL